MKKKKVGPDKDDSSKKKKKGQEGLLPVGIEFFLLFLSLLFLEFALHVRQGLKVLGLVIVDALDEVAQPALFLEHFFLDIPLLLQPLIQCAGIIRFSRRRRRSCW